jgi:ribokinase
MTVYVIGNVAVDDTFHVALMPRPGESILASGRTRDLGGKGANQAIVLARAGLEVRLIAAVGNDGAAEWIRRELALEGLDTNGLFEFEGASDVSVIILDGSAENMIVTTRSAAAGLDPAFALNALGAAGPGDALLMQGNLDPGLTRTLLACGCEKGLTTVFNPSPVHRAFSDLWAWVDIAVFNQSEASALTGQIEPIGAAHHLHGQGVGSVVITLGAQGALLLDSGDVHEIPAVPVAAVDSTGAGDTFVAILVAAASLRRRLDAQCAAAANEAAAITVSRLGTRAAFPHPDEIRSILARHR